eukprot:scaffold209578_cov49-Prasinocladus_malaysianus.AAC.2
MAPEMLRLDVNNLHSTTDEGPAAPMRSVGYGPEVDVWACGVCLYIMLSGFPPFEGSDMLEVMTNVRTQEPSYDDPAWEMVSPEAQDFVSRLLSRDPGERMTVPEALEHPWLD